MSIATVVTRGFGTFGTVNFLPTLGYGDYDADTGRSKDYSIGGIPIPFEDESAGRVDRLYERRRQQLHEDQIVIDMLVQAVVSRMLK